MAKLNLKSIFSSTLITFSVFKKIKLDGFAGGLIFGAVFSLLVNLITVQIQEMIQKQRILEAVENEILSNTLAASGVISNVNKIYESKESPNIFHPFFRYTNDLWTQSTEPLQYIAQLDPKIQTGIYIYYTTTLKHLNSMIEKYDEIARKKLENCYEFTTLSEQEKNNCNRTYWMILRWESEAAGRMADEGFSLLKEFHPTQDRLNSNLLKLFMGNKSTKILSTN